MPTKSQILRENQILSVLVETRHSVLVEVSKLSEAEQDQVFLGVWSVKDILAHFIGWDKTNLLAAKSILKGELPAFYEHRDPDWQTYNAILVKKYKKGSFQELLTVVKNSQNKLIKFLQTIPPEHFNKDFGVRFRGYKVTIQRLLEAEREDEETHLQQITDFFKKQK
jgi:hypothetical protein